MDDETQDQVFQKLKATGEGLKPELWTAGDLGALQAIAADVVGLDRKAQVALQGQPGIVPPILHPPVYPPVVHPPVVHPPVVHPPVVHPPVFQPPTRPPVAPPLRPVMTESQPAPRLPAHIAPLAEVAPQHVDAIVRAAPGLDVSTVLVIRPVPPDPAKAQMYRKAADRAIDSAANLALVRMQANAAQADTLRQTFNTRLWDAVGGMLPGLTGAIAPMAPDASKPAT
jgi:hypothetical protein